MRFDRIRLAGMLSLMVSCGDRPLPAAAGAASLHWDTSTTGSSAPTCVPGPHWANAPVSPNDEQLVFADRMTGAKVVDGVDGGRVRCRVAPQDDKYLVATEIRSEGVGPDGTSLVTDVVMNVLIAQNEPQAQGTLYITDEKSQRITFSSDTTIVPPKPGCLFSVDPVGQLGVAPRHIWGRVTCAHISDWRNRDKQECSISEGFFLLDNCGEE
jgi:hypothetical protein